MLAAVKKAIKSTPWLFEFVKVVRKMAGYEEVKWGRVVMLREKRKLIDSLAPATLSVLEISGRQWESMGFASYSSVFYPDFDICKDRLDQSFDLVMAQQVFEHLADPAAAAANVLAMLRPGGHFLVSTPFMVRIHPDPLDFIRWTESGLKRFLVECGFAQEGIVTDSWGNRGCIRANLRNRWADYNRYFHSLKNHKDVPVHVWALARKGE